MYVYIVYDQRQIYYLSSKLKHCIDRIFVFQNGKIKDRCV